MKRLSVLGALVGAAAVAWLGSAAATAAPPNTPPGFEPSGVSLPANSVQPDYQLGPFDKISVTVFGQKDLSVEKTQIDAAGNVVLPLVGVVAAGGKTASELSSQVEQMLGEEYLVSPHVSVLIDESVSQKVTVTGAVIEPGVFNLKGYTTLMQAIAMAKGVDRKTGNLHHVVVFRQIDGKDARALFDLTSIEAGKSPDPAVLGGDSIIVEGSTGKQFWRELVAALPALAVFAYF